MIDLNDGCILTTNDSGEVTLEENIYFYSSLLSIIGSLAIIITCTFIPELRKQPYSFVVYLSLCDFFFSLKYFVFSFQFSWVNTVDGCIIQSAWTQFWGLGSASWNGVIALNVLLLFRNALTQFNYTPLYHLYVWCICSLTTALLLLSGSYGTSFDDVTCWICKEKRMAHLLFFGPLILYFVISISTLLYAAFRVKFILRRKRGEKRVLLRMLFFIVVFLGVWTIPCIHLGLIMSDHNNIPWIGYLDSLMIGIQGFANAIVWLTSPYFLAQIKRSPLFVKLSLCKRGSKEEENEEGIYIDPMSDLYDRMRRNAICAFVCGIHSHVNNQRMAIPKRKGKRAEFETEDYEEEMEISNLSWHEEKEEEKINKNIENKEEKIEIEQETENEIKIEIEKDFKDFTMKIYAPKIFSDLRNHFSISNQFFLDNLNVRKIVQALNKRKFSEGRSGSILIVIPNNPFIIKLISETEALLLISLIKNYYKHMTEEENETIINKYYGLYSMRTPYLPQATYAIIMNNLFYQTLPISARYDLKGSWVRRQVGEKHTKNPMDVLGMDQDFKDLFQYLNIGRDQREALINAVKFDTKFLRSSGIIDYSLLLGIHETRSSSFSLNIEEEEVVKSGSSITLSGHYKSSNISSGIQSVDNEYIYYLGIIDMLQLYDCNKTTEYCLKVYLQRKDGDGVSVQPPKKYAERFVKYITDITR